MNELAVAPCETDAADAELGLAERQTFDAIVDELEGFSSAQPELYEDLNSKGWVKDLGPIDVAGLRDRKIGH